MMTLWGVELRGARLTKTPGANRGKFVTVTNFASQAEADVRTFYFFAPAGGTGTGTGTTP